MIKVHHLDLCPMFPPPGRFLHDEAHLVGHSLLLETESSGLVLVDTGLGLADVADKSRLGKGYLWFNKPRLDPAHTALRQIEGLGLRPEDVRHIVLTHLDVDHAGGMADFPSAKVHVATDEHAAAMARRTSNEKQRYRPAQWEHGPDWTLYDRGAGEPWFGFEAVRSLPGLTEDILAIPMIGHTRGHSAIAVREGDRWLLDAGDTYFHRGEVATPAGDVPRFLRLFERNLARNWKKLVENQERLRELGATHSDELTIFCAHDPAELAPFVPAAPS